MLGIITTLMSLSLCSALALPAQAQDALSEHAPAVDLPAEGSQRDLAPQEAGAVQNRYQAAYQSYLQHAERNNFEAALPHAQEAYLLGKSVVGEGSEAFANLTYNYGLTLLETGAAERAYPLLQDAVKQYEGLFGKQALQLSTLLAHLATAAANSGDLELAQQHFDRALAIVEQRYGRESLPVATLALHAGIALAENGEFAKARPYLLSSHGIHLERAGAEDRGTALAAFYLGQSYFKQDNYSAAVPHLEASLKGFELDLDADRQYALEAHVDLVIAYEILGQSDAATEHCLVLGASLPEVYAKGFRPLFEPKPDYPAGALRSGTGATVVVEFSVDERGFVRELEAIDIEGDEIFLEPALEAASRYRFAPRFIDGRPVTAENIQARLSFTPPQE